MKEYECDFGFKAILTYNSTLV